MKLPIIRIEIEQVKEHIAHAMVAHENEWNTMVQEELNRQFNADNLQIRIGEAVSKCIDAALKSVADDWRLQEAIKEVIVDNVIDKVKS